MQEKGNQKAYKETIQCVLIKFAYKRFDYYAGRNKHKADVGHTFGTGLCYNTDAGKHRAGKYQNKKYYDLVKDI